MKCFSLQSHYRHGDKKTQWELNLGHLHRRQACYQPSYHIQCKDASSYETYEVTGMKVENKIVYYKETVECRHLLFCLGS
jgi:hypothetical protein